MTSVMSHAHAGSSTATDKQLLDAFTLGGGDRGDGGFGVEEAGMGGSSGVGGFFLPEGDNELMLQHIQAALVGASAAVGNSSLSSSGATTALASSSASSDSGADAHGDDKDAWKSALIEGLEDSLLQLGAMPDSLHPGSRRFSFDLTGIDMAALGQLTAASPGPSSRRGSISLSFLEAEGVLAMPKLWQATSAAAAATSSSTAAAVQQQAAAATAPATPLVKPEPPANDASAKAPATTAASTGATTTDASSVSTSATAASSSSSSSSSSSGGSSSGTKRKTPAGGANGGGAGTKRKLAAGASSVVPKEEAPSSPALASTAAAMMLPTPQTPLHRAAAAAPSGDVTSPTGARGASAATTAAMASMAATAATGTGNGTTGGPSYALPVLPDDGVPRVGIYTLEERKARVARFQAKRGQRVWKKAVKYACRKNLADNRPRVKGRFVKREEEIDILVGTAMAASSAQQGSLLDQLCGLDDLMLQLAE